MIGRSLLHYRIESQLGQGGMGVVYRALDTKLNRPVAVKVLPPEAVADPARKHRFVQEARAASALNHPNIITIHDIETAEGVDFIVMEYVTGRSLDHVIPQQGLPLGEVLHYAIEIADALAGAHAAGIVHRDLKPGNVMVTDKCHVKILDFGLAKLVEAGEGSDSAATKTAHPQTEAGAIVGTAAYMSPEQAEGKPVDPRSDIFSFGVVLYEMVTGRRPFQGESKMATLAAILHTEPPPVSEAADGVPRELERVIANCLRKDRSRRLQHIGDIKIALQDIEAGAASGPAGASESTWISKRWWAWATPVALLLIGAAFSVFRPWGPSEPADPLRAVAMTTFPGQEQYPSISPDGKQVTFSWNGPKQDNFNIYVQLIGAGVPLQLTTSAERDYNPVWSPDGRWIAFLRTAAQPLTSEVRLIAPLGGPERKVAEIRAREIIGVPMLLSWCPDSTCVVVTDSPGNEQPDAIFALSLDTGEKRQLTSPEPTAHGDSQPAISPDGRWLVFRRNISGGLTGELYLLPLNRNLTPAGRAVGLTPAAFNANYPVWMSDSRELVFSAQERLWRVLAAGKEKPTPLPFVGEDGKMPTISRPNDGSSARLIYVRSFADTNIWRVDTNQTGARSVAGPVIAISSTRQDGNPQLSPNGLRVAFTSNRSGSAEIWVADLDGSNAYQLTTMGAPATGSARWSPDGESISFNCNLEGHWDIYVVAASGGKPRRLTDDRANDDVPSFSHDGRWLYFNSNRTGEYQIWKIPIAGGQAVQVTDNGGYVGFEAPDGKYLYYTQTLAGPSALWRIPTSGGQPEKVLEGIVWRSFAVLERGIYYIDETAAASRLQFFDFATRRVTTIVTGLGELSYGLTASSDGRTILYTRVDSTIDDLMLVEKFR